MSGSIPDSGQALTRKRKLDDDMPMQTKIALLLFGIILSGCAPVLVPATPRLLAPTDIPVARSTETVTPLPEPTTPPESAPKPEPTTEGENAPTLEPESVSDGWCVPGGGFDPSFRVIGYLPEYRHLEPGWGNCLTDLILFSVAPLADGGLDTSLIRPDLLKALSEMKQRYGTRLHLAVGGYKRGENFAVMAVDPKKRAKFIKNLTEFVAANNFNGVDYDWEFPETKNEAKGYVALISETKQALHPHGMLVSVALYPLPALDVLQYGVADRIHVMSYDRGERHATYQQAVDDMQFFLDAGLSRDKLILGIPFYGRAISVPRKSYTYSEIVQDYFPLPETDELPNLYFNGKITVQRKTCYARDEGFGGVMIWELGQDSLSIYSLLRSVYAGAISGCDVLP
jgi:hypothetical protein